MDDSRQSERASEMSLGRPTLSSKPSLGQEFAREPDCGVCKKAFNLLRRRHHCRGCHVAICKDCGKKAIDHRKGENSKPQWYCITCTDEDPSIEVVGVSRNTITSKRMSFSSLSMSQGPSSGTSAKFCIECGYELPHRVKFCIECGTAVRPAMSSPQHTESKPIEESPPRKSSRATSQASTLTSIDEHRTPTGSFIALTTAQESPEETEAIIEEKDQSLNALSAENEKLKLQIEQLKRKLVDAEKKASIANGATESANGGNASSDDSSGTRVDAGLKAKEHPDYAKFFKLLSMGLPAEQVKMKMQQAGVDPSVLDNPDAILGGSGGSSSSSGGGGKDSNRSSNSNHINEGGGTLVKNDERYAKFFKLMKMGMPAEQIKMKMSAEGLDPTLLDTPDAIMPGTGDNAGSNTLEGSAGGMTVKEDPEYEKFFKLMKMGMPAEQIKLKMSAAGLKPELLDTPDAPSPNDKKGSSTTPSNGLLAGLPPKKEAVKVDESALKASLASKLKLQPSVSKKKVEEPQLPKKEVIKPNVELRPLFWTRIPVNVVSSTLWMKLSDEHACLDFGEMEWMFRKNPIDDGKQKKKDTPTNSSNNSNSSSGSAGKEVLLLDPKRQQNVAIAIARFRMTPNEMKKAIYALDTQRITSEKLNVLISIAPTLEEQDLLKNYEGDESLLGNVEKFFLELLTIPRYTQRIKCFRFKLQFENRILETQAQLDTLVAATDQVMDSDKLKVVLENILAIGNYLNGNTPRGGAYGFKLDTLTKLHTLRSVDPKITLMHFLLHQLEEKNPQVIAFAGELPHVSEAKRLSLDQLRADINMYNAELQMLQGQVRASKNDDIDEDKFYEEMLPFSKDAAEVLEELGRDFNSLETSYHELITSFGEDPRKLGPMEFFSIIEEFVNEFKKAYRQNQTKEYQTLWETAKQMREEMSAAAAAAEAEAATVVLASPPHSTSPSSSLPVSSSPKKAEPKHDNIAASSSQAEVPSLVSPRSVAATIGDTILSVDQAKQVYTQITTLISAWTKKNNVETLPTPVEQFKAVSRKYGNNEVTADDFCDTVRSIVGTKTSLKIIPESARLLSDLTKRHDLLKAYERYFEKTKKEKEEKKKNIFGPSCIQKKIPPPPFERRPSGSSIEGKSYQTKGPGKKSKGTIIKVEDIEPVVGEAAQQLHKSILESVQQAFHGDKQKMKLFTTNARKYGSEQISAREFYKYLTESFEMDFVGRLVPDLARLLQDHEKRHALIRALCESAPGWEKFSGL